MSDADEFDAIPNEFEGLDFDAVPALAIPHPTRPTSAASQYSCDAQIDESYLVAIDALENQLGESSNVVKSPLPLASEFSRFFDSGQVIEPNHPSKSAVHEKVPDADFAAPATRNRDRACSSDPVSAEKGKNRMDPDDGVKQILEDFEDEMTCPICCDIFVAAHLGNPCGHSFCGGCGWEWISKNKRSPTCAICRAKLFRSAPMIPNFALDNTVNRHILALASSGRTEWQTGGARIKEWNLKKEMWKKDSEKRTVRTALKKKSRTRRQTHQEFMHPDNNMDVTVWLVPDNEIEFVDDDSDYLPDELLVVSTTSTTSRLRSRRSRGQGHGQRGAQ